MEKASKSMKSEQKLTSLSFDPFPSFSILFCVKGEKGGKRKQKENALFLMWSHDALNRTEV